MVKKSACSARDQGLILGLRRSPGEGNGNPFQYSCLENSMDRGAWWATVHRVAESDMTEQLTHTHTHARTHTHWNFKNKFTLQFQLSSVTLSCPTLCDPKDCSTPGFPVHHQLLEFTQTHVHRVSDAIQPSHPLSSHSPLTFNLSQHQGLF